MCLMKNNNIVYVSNHLLLLGMQICLCTLIVVATEFSSSIDFNLIVVELNLTTFRYMLSLVVTIELNLIVVELNLTTFRYMLSLVVTIELNLTTFRYPVSNSGH